MSLDGMMMMMYKGIILGEGGYTKRDACSPVLETLEGVS